MQFSENIWFKIILYMISDHERNKTKIVQQESIHMVEVRFKNKQKN